MAEAGLPEVEQAGWVGLFAAAGTTRDILGRISGEVARAVRAPIVAARIRASSYDAGGGTPEQFAAKFRADVARFMKIVRDIGVPPVEAVQSDQKMAEEPRQCLFFSPWDGAIMVFKLAC